MNKTVRKIILLCLLVLPVIIGVKIVANDQIAFWYDPARDFLLALENLKKITLIGQPSGIPGLFYGPYWIWMISLGLLVSPDPRIVTILIATLPYTILFPLCLYKLRNVFGRYYWIFLWLFYFSIFSAYAVSLWNVNPAPLIIVILTYYTTLIGIPGKVKIYNVLLSGLLVGLLINFHISFGIAVAFATVLFTLIISLFKSTSVIKKITNTIIILGTLLWGITITFLPFLIFEIRHGFNQIKVMQKVIIDASFYNSAAVGVTGLTKTQIYSEFFQKLQSYFPQSFDSQIIILLIITMLIIYTTRLLKREDEYKSYKLGFLLYILLCLGSIMLVYTKSKNPVWEYHFIGLEIFFLLLIGLVTSEFKVLKLVVAIVALFATAKLLYSTFILANPAAYSLSSLHTKKHIVDIIYTDAGSKPFTVFVYSPAIYTYDYDYLFEWFGKDKYKYYPQHDIKNNTPVYLVLPKTEESIKNDFINYKTPQENFITGKEWNIEDGSKVIKRIPKTNNY